MNATVSKQLSFPKKTISKADGSPWVDALAFRFGRLCIFFLAFGSTRDVD